MDYREHLIVRPGRQVRLKAIDPGYSGQDESHEKAGPEIERYLAEMSALQVLLYAERKHALLIVLQGIDAAGKDGVCWHVVKGMNPRAAASPASNSHRRRNAPTISCGASTRTHPA